MSTETTIPPAPQPPTGLTSAHAAVYSQLVVSPGTTAADIAVAAGVGRSTAGKALAALEQRGLATRTPGDQHNGRCVPDRWHPTELPSGVEDEAATAAAVYAHDPSPAADATPVPAPAPAEEPLTDQQPETEDTAPSPVEPDNQTSVNTELAPTPEQQTATAPPPIQEPTATAPSPSDGQRSRLAPGALRRMVIDHLTTHPTEAFTATGISRAIEKSSGAIANCLVTLVAHGLAEQVSEKPRTYRLAGIRTAGTE